MRKRTDGPRAEQPFPAGRREGGGGASPQSRAFQGRDRLPRKECSCSQSHSHSHSHSGIPGARAAQGAGSSALTGWQLPPGPAPRPLLRRLPRPLRRREGEKPAPHRSREQEQGRAPRLGRHRVHTAGRRSVKPDSGRERDRPVNKPGHLPAGKGRDCPSCPSIRLAPASPEVPVKPGVASVTWELPSWSQTCSRGAEAAGRGP